MSQFGSVTVAFYAGNLSDRVRRNQRRGPKAFADWLNTKGVENIENVNKALKAAHSWFDKVQAAALV